MSKSKDVKEEVSEKKEEVKKNEKVVKMTKANDGQVKCPNCGASELVPDPKTGKLKCNYCFSEINGDDLIGVEKDLKKLRGLTKSSGMSDIKADASDVVTLKCGGCGAEVVIDTTDAPHARCHWCRSILSINSQIENGATPDAILPFKTTKESAQAKIETFVKKRKFFAHPVFRKEFTTDNIMGVYFPYMLVDANCQAEFKGIGEHLVRRYTVGSGDNRKTYYDADSYKVERKFDITIDDLSIESNSARLDKTSNEQTNNIINSIMPFDTENCIQYKANYLIGYTSERRDINVGNIEGKVTTQMKDIARFSIKDDLKFYDRGISWQSEDLRVIGTQWVAAYLPVWLYSYQEVKGKKKVLHYVAVNARTNETMGSVPINMPLLVIMSVIVEFIGGAIGILLSMMPSSDDDSGSLFLLLFLSGFVFYGIMYARYRNKSARHTYEKETKKEVSNIERVDELLEHKKRLSNSSIAGRNDNKIEGDSIDKSSIDSILHK